MSIFGKVCVFGTAALALSACGGLELGKAQSVSATGAAFDQYLYTEYLSLATIEYDEGDRKDSDVFALRAIAAGSGNSPAPEMISARSVPAANVDELTTARARLITAFDKGAAEKMPQPAARAQAMYECWIQEQETPENFQPGDIAFCRNGFADAMGKVEAGVMTAQVMPQPAAAPQPAAKPMPGPFMVYFDFESAILTPTARKVVADAARAAAEVKPASVFVVGYTDRAGKDAFNMTLSMRRAEAVAAELEMQGFKAEVTVSGHGEDQSHVSTPDGQREYRNRVASIDLR